MENEDKFVSRSTLLVRPEHLNHHGFLFGGRLLEWLDEQAYLALVTLLKPQASLVTVSIDRIQFRHQVKNGEVLRFRSQLVHVGKTSLTVHTEVFRLPVKLKIFRAYVTFTCLDDSGSPTAVEPLLLEPFSADTERAKSHYQVVETLRKTYRDEQAKNTRVEQK